MKIPASLLLCALCVLCGSRKTNAAEPPENFKRENLVAWCIVPFDAKKRGPAERAELLVELGLRRVAYDWRAEHVPAFEEEILQYEKHGLEYFAFWNQHEEAFTLFEKHDLHPQIWKTNPSPKQGTQEEKVAAAAETMLPLAKRAAKMGCRLGLYNHGGWGGEPENLVAVCEHLNSVLRVEGDSGSSVTLVGIVYNFHHGHERIERFAEAFELMKPHLLCLNLNGMTDPETVTRKKNKILPIGAGKHEKAMIEAVIESGYTGPVGILGHIAEQDVRVSLENNLEGLEKTSFEVAVTADRTVFLKAYRTDEARRCRTGPLLLGAILDDTKIVKASLDARIRRLASLRLRCGFISATLIRRFQMSKTVPINPITASYYRELPEGPPFYQLIDGNLEMTPAPNLFHQIVSRNLLRILDTHINQNQLGELLYAPVDLFLTDNNVFQPDLVFVAAASRSFLRKEGIHGGPELVVEILSPSTAQFDLGHKKTIYARCGVLEYWVVDPDSRRVTVFDFNNSAEEPATTLHESGILTSSQFPGLEISLTEVFAGPELGE